MAQQRIESWMNHFVARLPVRLYVYVSVSHHTTHKQNKGNLVESEDRLNTRLIGSLYLPY